MAKRLHRVGMEGHAVLMSDARKLGDGLHRADLVVGEHDGRQDGVGRSASSNSSGQTTAPRSQQDRYVTSKLFPRSSA